MDLNKSENSVTKFDFSFFIRIFTLTLLLLAVPPNLFSELINKTCFNKSLIEMRIRTSGHVRFCLKNPNSNEECTNALKKILDLCPSFFAIENQPLFFALVAISKEKHKNKPLSQKKKSQIRQRTKFLKRQKLYHLLGNRSFRKAIITYVIKNEMIKKSKTLWKKAETIVNSQKTIGEHHVQSNPFIWAFDHVIRLSQTNYILNRLKRN